VNEVLALVVFSNKSAVFNKYVKSEGASHYLTNQNIRSDKNIYFGVMFFAWYRHALSIFGAYILLAPLAL
jgi:hypothetical protein